MGIGAGDQARPDQVVAGIGDYGNESMTHTWLIFMPSFRVYGTPPSPARHPFGTALPRCPCWVWGIQS